MTLSEPWAIAVVGFFATCMVGWLGRLQISVADNLRRTTQLETKVELFWKGLGERMATLLHSPHTKLLDELLERYQRAEISRPEVDCLRDRLELIERGESADHEESPAARVAASLLLEALKQHYS